MTYTVTTNNATTILSVCATTSDKIKDLVIKNGQLIFVHDAGRIALDYKDKRTFYNQIIELETEKERLELSDPVNGKYYFVIETAIFWRYFNEWIQLTTSPNEVIFIGTELPELGQQKTLYVNKEEKEISVWDETSSNYIAVSNYTDTISTDEIAALFS